MLIQKNLMRNLIKNVFHKRNKSGGIHQHQINSEIADLLIKTNLKSLALAALIASLLIYLQIGSENISACLSWFGILSGAYLLHHLISHVYFKKISTYTAVIGSITFVSSLRC